LTHGGGGVGGYTSSLNEINTVVRSLGGQGGHGIAEICFFIQADPH
jgi:hypothetical protein